MDGTVRVWGCNTGGTHATHASAATALLCWEQFLVS
jgi:hypothetical protein